MIGQYVFDCLRAAAAFFLLAPLLVFPGYLLCEAADLFRFRTQSFLTRLCLSMGFSIAVTPILLFLLWSIAAQCVVVAYWLLAASGFALLLVNRRRVAQARIPSSLLWIAAIWVVVVLFSLVDLPLGDGLYITGVAEPDHSFRVEIIAQLARTAKLPPTFPFLSGELGRTVLRYHYFWFMVCGVIPKITLWRIGARDALNGSVLWIGFLLLAMIGLYWKFVFHARQALRRTLLSIPVLLLGGLQGPLFLAMLAYHRWRWGLWGLTRPTLTWIESTGQITYWTDSVFWVPNHVAAALSSVAALLALYGMSRSPSWRQRAVLMIVAGVSLASTVGLSVFVGMPFFAFVGILCACGLVKAPRNRLWMELACSLGIGLALCAPYLLSIRAPAGTPFPVELSVRPSTLAITLAKHIHHLSALGRQALNLAVEPAVFFYELGILAVIAVWAFVHRSGTLSGEDRERNRLIALFVAITLAITLFLKSRDSAGSANDLGWRVPLGGLFFLVFYAVFFFEQWRKNGAPPLLARRAGIVRPILIVLVIAGFSTTLGEVLLLRLYFVAENSPEQASATADLRAATNFLRAHSAVDAVVQLNPENDDPAQSGLFLERRTALRSGSNYFYRYNALNPEPILQTEQQIVPLFSNTALRFSQVEQACSALEIDYLIVRRDDDVLREHSSWAWQVDPIYQNPTFNIYRCRGVS